MFKGAVCLFPWCLKVEDRERAGALSASGLSAHLGNEGKHWCGENHIH